MRTEECGSCVKEPTGRISAARFIRRLDQCFARNDLKEAGACIVYWEQEARNLGDLCGLLTVKNEQLGYYRRTDDKKAGLEAVEEAVSLVEELGMEEEISGATILVNAATTLKAFGEAEKGIPFYDRAEKVYLSRGMGQAYEYAAMLNNRAAAFCDLARYEEGEQDYRNAVRILKEEGAHDGEIAVSLVNLAHLTFDRDGSSYEQVEALLDAAWEYINSRRQPHDGNYAFILSKCAPSFSYFGRKMEAAALLEVAEEIYDGNGTGQRIL